MDQLVSFWEFAAKLKTERRKGWLKNLRLQRTESVADHSFALSLLCLFEGERRGCNMDKLLRLALLHDLEESITGDLTPEDKYSKGAASVKAQKLSAREQLLSGFPERNRQTYRGLWLELDADNSKEAKLVHELDKLEMALQAKEYARRGIDPVKLGQFYATAKASISDPGLREILDELAA